MKTKTAALGMVALWIGLSGLALAGSSEDPRDWLERMSAAMSQMSYQGTFVYVQGDDVVTMRITHLSDQTGVRERLVSLSGAPREVLRDSSGVRWVLGSHQSVLEDSAFNKTFFPDLPIDRTTEIDQSYVLKFGGKERIAGQVARNLKVLPRDNYRYGYSLWLEQHSGILLKWELIDSDRKSLAKLMFTDIRLGSEVDPDELNPSSQLGDYRTVESKLPAGRVAAQDTLRWHPERLPPGFSLTAHRLSGQQSEGMYEHLVYSDGLAAVSVYVESGGAGQQTNSGAQRGKLGTTHTFSRYLDDVSITVVGDVPAVTVEFIANAVTPVSP